LQYLIVSPQYLASLGARQTEINQHPRAYMHALADALDRAERHHDPEAEGEMKIHLRVPEACADSMAAMLRGIAEGGS